MRARRPVIVLGALALAIGGVAIAVVSGRAGGDDDTPRAAQGAASEGAAETETAAGSRTHVTSSRPGDDAPSALSAEQGALDEDGTGDDVEPGDDERPGALARTPDALLERLASDDPFEVLDAADGLAARKVVRAIPTLAAMDITKSAHSAPSIVHALGQLAAHADPTNRTRATERLVALLAEEKARAAPESAGNVLAIYEALGETRDPAAAPPLEAELKDPAVTLAARTVVVSSLVSLGQARSRAAFAEARAEVSAMTPADELEAEIRQELLADLDRALATLR